MTRTLLTPVLAFALLTAFGQAGSNDPTFNPADIGEEYGADRDILTSLVQPDGKILIGGGFTTYDGRARNRIARLNIDGTPDTTFLIGSGADKTVRSIALQPDGKIIISGKFQWFNGVACNHIARLNSDGSLDSGFVPGTGTDGLVRSTALQADGKILIGGDFSQYDGIGRNRIARLNPDGSLDTEFDPAAGVDNQVRSIALQSDGKIIIAGNFNHFNGSVRKLIARLNTDGSVDTSFISGTVTNHVIRNIHIQSDGKIIIDGEFQLNHSGFVKHLARLNTDGSVDSFFNPDLGTNFLVDAATYLPNTNIIVSGWFDYGADGMEFHEYRMNWHGSIDWGFHGGNANGHIFSICPQSDGKIILSGGFTIYNTEHGRIARVEADGTLDAGFDPLITGGANESIRCATLQPDGKIIIGGLFTNYNYTDRNHIARLNADGSLDHDFDPGAGTTGTVEATAVQPDGKILVGGDFQITGCPSCPKNLLRFNTDGSLDTTFHAQEDGWVRSIRIQPDGKILICGQGVLNQPGHQTGISRLNPDGSLDVGFGPAPETFYMINSLELQPDGKIIAAGTFNTYGSDQHQFPAIRLNADGSLDSTFALLNLDYPSPVYATALQPDGKVLIGGYFARDSIIRSVLRLNADGTLDQDFRSGNTDAGLVYSLSLQDNGKVIAGGNFNHFNGALRRHVARLNANGSVDSTFIPGPGADATVWCTALQPEGKVLIGGDFHEYDGAPRTRLARVIGCNDGEPCAGTPGLAPPQHEAFMVQPDANVALRVWPNPSDGGQLHLLVNGLGDDLRQIEVELYDAMGRRAMDTTLPVEEGRVNTDLEVDHMAQGIYMLKVHEGERTSSERVVVN